MDVLAVGALEGDAQRARLGEDARDQVARHALRRRELLHLYAWAVKSISRTPVNFVWITLMEIYMVVHE